MPSISPQMKRVVIVGGGAAGVWQAAALAASGITEVDIVEPSAVLGRGLAYSAPNPDHLLNVTPAKMDPHLVPGFEGFVAWLARRNLQSATGYFPRAVFGDYMEDVVRQIRTRAVLRHHQAKAVDISQVGGGFTVTLDSREPLSTDHVILAVGNLAPQPIAPHLFHLCVIEDPWHLLPADVAGVRKVVIAGTGLTAIDVAIAVISAAPAAHVTMTAHRPFMPPADAAVDAWSGASAVAAARPSQVWREVVREIRRGTGDQWIGIFEGMKTQSPRIWQAWSPEDRATFRRHGLRHWLHHRHRTPSPSHALIQRSIAAGQLDLVRGRVGNVAPDAAGIRMTIGNVEMTACLLINATGPSVRPDDDPLLAAARARGLITADPLRLGLSVDVVGRALAPDGQPVPGLWVLGAWTRGTHFEAVAVPLLRKHAVDIASAIADPVACS